MISDLILQKSEKNSDGYPTIKFGKFFQSSALPEILDLMFRTNFTHSEDSKQPWTSMVVHRRPIFYLLTRWDLQHAICKFSFRPKLQLITSLPIKCKVLNGGASFRWSFGPHNKGISAWCTIESTAILTTNPSLLPTTEWYRRWMMTFK